MQLFRIRVPPPLVDASRPSNLSHTYSPPCLMFDLCQTSMTHMSHARAARNLDRTPRLGLSSQQDCISLALRAPWLGSEAFCPNIQPRAHARLTGLTTPRAEYCERNAGLTRGPFCFNKAYDRRETYGGA